MERFEFIMNTLTPTAIGAATEDKWMTMSNMGFLLAKK
jgi:hypothetical protein